MKNLKKWKEEKRADLASVLSLLPTGHNGYHDATAGLPNSTCVIGNVPAPFWPHHSVVVGEIAMPVFQGGEYSLSIQPVFGELYPV